MIGLVTRSFTLLWSLSVPPVLAEQSVQSRAPYDICTLLGQGVAIIGNHLFLAQGLYTFDGGSNTSRVMKLLSLDLSVAFDAAGYVSSAAIDSKDLPTGVIADDSGVFFHDSSSAYFYNPTSALSDGVTSIAAWLYNTVAGQFLKGTVTGLENVANTSAVGAWISNPATGLTYFTGAVSSALARRAISTPWLQILNTTNPTQPQWIAGAGDGPVLSAAQMVYVRAGKAGVLVAMGGVDPNDHTQFASTTLGAYRDMSQIFVYDIDSRTWFTVTATGATGPYDIPDSRIDFCATVSSAPDDSSFQITIYGGYNLRHSGAMSGVYVLTLPTFQWINVTPLGGSGAEAGFSSGLIARQGPRCVMWQDAQMLVIGGLVRSTSTSPSVVGTYNDHGCNSSHPPILVLDTTTYQWQSQFNPSKTYSQPAAVIGVLGGNSSGFNTKRAPPLVGFQDPRLFYIFNQTVPRSTPVSSAQTSLPAQPSQTQSQPVPAVGTSRAGVIAGAVIGGSFIVVAIIGAVWFLWRRRRRQSTRPAVQEEFQKAELPANSKRPKPSPSTLPTAIYELPSTERVFELDGGPGVSELSAFIMPPRGRGTSFKEAKKETQ